MNEGKAQHEEKHDKDEREEEIFVEIIDLEELALAKKHPCKAKKYRIKIDKEKFTVEKHLMTGKEILALVGKTPDNSYLYMKFADGRREQIQPDHVVEFHRCEVERFETLPKEQREGDAPLISTFPR
ncbi:multiubiquitin domain-containing protein [Methanoregula sp.]|uniref:multiubiquitin domain-containing protein n=1 Tax=Methanoregula sp. TaxID=2052170 RepID=UPI003BB0E0E9